MSEEQSKDELEQCRRLMVAPSTYLATKRRARHPLTLR
jgi:hypothetical protein